jgi:hypothetical protein
MSRFNEPTNGFINLLQRASVFFFFCFDWSMTLFLAALNDKGVGKVTLPSKSQSRFNVPGKMEN